MKKCMVSAIAVLMLLVVCGLAGAGAAAEESSGTRTQYLAGQGTIVYPEDIVVDEFISAVDYGYPEPESSIGVYAYPAQYQISLDTQELLLSIGVQAARRSVEDLPPLNIAFVVDVSGSMGSADKIDWVRDSLEVFERSVRPQDIVSLVTFTDNARVRMPTTRMDSERARTSFLSQVRRLQPEGSTNLYEGLEQGMAQILPNLSSEYVNRIVLLSDGLPTAGIQDPEAFRELASNYGSLGISISAIGLGAEADLGLIRDVSHWSSGTSRFINNRETMEETFGSGLGRLLVAVAHDIVLEVQFASGTRPIETWGYDHEIIGSTITYRIPAVHDSDYETVVAAVELPRASRQGNQRIATIATSYLDGSGRLVRMEPTILDIERVDMEFPVEGVTSAMALRSSTMLRYGQVMLEVGRRYYDEHSHTPDGGLEAGVAEALLGMVSEFKFDMENAQLRLDEEVFADELTVLEIYQDILAEELEIAEASRRQYYDRYHRRVPTAGRSVSQHVDALVRELRLSMLGISEGRVAILGFSGIGDVDPVAEDLIARRTYDAVSSLRALALVSEQTVAAHLRSNAISSSDLTDAALAAQIGRELGADYVITGMMISSANSVHFFERVIQSSSGEVVSAAQVIVAR